MNKSQLFLNVLKSKDNSFSNLKLQVYEIEGSCKYKDVSKILDPLGVIFDLHRGSIYLTENLPHVKEVLEKGSLKIKQEYKAEFDNLYNMDRNRLYRILYKSFENFIRSKGFETSRKHKRRHEKVALPITSVFKETNLVRKGKTDKSAYLVKEGFEYFFFIYDDGTVTLRIDPRPQILIPGNKVVEGRYNYTPLCAKYDCEKFSECNIHGLGPVIAPNDADAEPVQICTLNELSDKEFSNMYCYRTKEVVAIPEMMLFLEASPANLRRLDIYGPEFKTLNKKPPEKFELTQNIVDNLSDNDRIIFPISKDFNLEFDKSFEDIEVEVWK